ALHLLSMPWSHPTSPSIQLGCLKAYMDERFQQRLETRTYSAFLTILHRAFSVDFSSEYLKLSYVGENVYFLISSDLFLRSPLGPDAPKPEELVTALCNKGDSALALDLTRALDRLKRATFRYLDDMLLPSLDENACNIVGFTMNYDQVYSSMLCAKYISQ